MGRHPARVSAVACLLACAVLAIAMPTTAGASPVARMLKALNSARTAHGRPPAKLSQRLAGDSRSYARHLARHGAFVHAAHLHAAGFRRVGEILALQPLHGCSMRRVVRMWLRSPTHRRIILRRSYRYIGVGAATARGMRYWVVRFGRR